LPETADDPSAPPRWTPRPLPPVVARANWPARIGLGAVVLLMSACVVLLVVANVPDQTALATAFVASFVPALGYAWLVLRLDRYEIEPRRALAAAFGWGAIGAVLFSVIFGLIFQLALLRDATPGQQLFFSVAIGAPLIEETFKGIALLALLFRYRHELDNVLDGMVYGALIGLGFAMTENVLYLGQAYLQGGPAGLGQLFLARVLLDGFGHAVYTGTTGAAVGWARQQYRQGFARFVVPVLGWMLAVLQHFLWNAGAFVIAGAQGPNATAVSVVLVEAPLFVLPALLLLVLIAHLAAARELRIMREQLAAEVPAGVLTQSEYDLVTDPRQRHTALHAAAQRGGRELRARQLRFFHVAAELAFRKYHLSRGEYPKPGQRAPEDAYREELVALRAELAPAHMIAAAG
jgi:RsiW-degrading membrane proteinase PrsW (M82 family)